MSGPRVSSDAEGVDGNGRPAVHDQLDVYKRQILTYTGPYNEMDKPYNWMFSEWLPGSGMVPADFPMFEQYLNDPRTKPPAQLQTRICMPLK